MSAGVGFADEWLRRVPVGPAVDALESNRTGTIYFLQIGQHSFEPSRIVSASGDAGSRLRDAPVVIAPFEQLQAVGWKLPENGAGRRVERARARDAFWDQVLAVDLTKLGELPRYRVVELGSFGSGLPQSEHARATTPAERGKQQVSLTDPILGLKVDREMSWDEIAGAAWPLDFQKVLLASFNDASPAFAFQNGQWFTTWLSRDLPQWNKEDHWFAPALLIGNTLVRPAPLSARTTWLKTTSGATLPAWNLEWRHEGITVRQQLLSLRASGDAAPRVWVRFELEHAPAGVKLALGLGRRINAHYWDDKKRERTPEPFFTLAPRYHVERGSVVDAWNHVILSSAQPFTLEPLGPVEMLAVFEPVADGRVVLTTPQTEQSAPTRSVTTADYARSADEFQRVWKERLGRGAQLTLPSPEWMARIDAWRAQVEMITRVTYQGKERLSYGAYFYQAYFGIEEGWPAVAMALWGRGEEAKRQAAIMLEAENLDKSNIHHQSRNGVGPTTAATVARLTHDRAWLETVAPALWECAQWTARVRVENPAQRSPLTRGLLPPHIYGGDVRDSATSLYATVACWRGLVETAAVFRALGSAERVTQAVEIAAEAERLRGRLSEVLADVAVRDEGTRFVPFALELPSLGGANEGPHARLTATRFGNYWNLFAPSFLELRFNGDGAMAKTNDWIFDAAQRRGGLWAGLPRFYDGLDAAYAIGYIGHLLDRSVTESGARYQALAALQSFFLHAASRNGYTIPEVAGLFADRLDPAAYEQLVREAPWSFGMYDAQRYLEGHISFTEPLGAGAGEALCLIRHALVSETRDAQGLPDGGLMLLPTVPSDWLAEGKAIVLRDFPTAYGTISATIRSSFESRREITMEYRFTPFEAGATLGRFQVRLAPPGQAPVDVSFDPLGREMLRVKF